MAIRLSGLASGMDTEAIVGALMSAQSLKKTKISNAKTKLEWKQDKWKELNTKLYKLYTEQASKMRLQSSYKTKKASVSNENVAQVSASANAANGSYTMEVKNIATSQYLTSAKLTSAKNASQKLVDVDSSLLNAQFDIKVGDKTSQFVVTSETTINDFTTALSEAGLNANFDETQQRFWISSKESGLANAFSITSTKQSDAQVQTTSDLKKAVGYSNMSSADKAIVDEALKSLTNTTKGSEEYETALENLAKVKSTNDATTFYKAQIYAKNYDEVFSKAEESLQSTYYEKDDDGNLTVKESLKEKYKTQYQAFTEEDKKVVLTEMGKDPDTDTLTEEDYIGFAAKKEYDAAVSKKADSDTVTIVNKAVSSAEGKVEIEALARTGVSEENLLALKNSDSDTATYSDRAKTVALAKYYDYGNDTSTTPITGFDGMDDYSGSGFAELKTAVQNYVNVSDRYDTSYGSALEKLGMAEIVVGADGVTVNGASADSTTTYSSGMAFVAASDSKILLNGAELTSGSSTVSANGLSINLTSTTKPGETVTFAVSNDVDAVYKSIKDALTEYNALIKEMNALYNASSAKGYEPLSSEEKEAMTEEDIKLYEDKIKSSLLRSDSSLSSVMNSMKSAMQTQIEYDGKKYSLASFGIMTSRDFTEGGQYHIYGDSEDSVYADQKDKLKTALENEPEKVMAVLSGVFGQLRNNMYDKMSATKVSSALTFYNDIKMKSDIDNYTSELKDWEEKLEDMEDAYYSQFTAMEKALAKLQSQQSSLSSLFSS